MFFFQNILFGHGWPQKIFSPFFSTIPEIIEVKVCEKQTDRVSQKLFDTINMVFFWHQVAFIILFTSHNSQSLVIIFVHWTQLLEYWSHDPNYMLWIILFHWKILALAGIWTWDLPGTKPICYQLSYPGLDPYTWVCFFFQLNLPTPNSLYTQGDNK